MAIDENKQFRGNFLICVSAGNQSHDFLLAGGRASCRERVSSVV